jgi:hypothetical protein
MALLDAEELIGQQPNRDGDAEEPKGPEEVATYFVGPSAGSGLHR